MPSNFKLNFLQHYLNPLEWKSNLLEYKLLYLTKPLYCLLLLLLILKAKRNLNLKKERFLFNLHTEIH